MSLWSWLKSLEDKNLASENALVDGALGKAKEFLWTRLLSKLVKRLAVLLLSLAAGQASVLVDVTPEQLTILMYALLEVLRGFLKQKVPALGKFL